ncbi:MAG: hypothetical protein E6Q83_00945 [Thiothrix sp.]|nr:MAG: hypothetical protein E6Q83_00945 [Thiothrix sp.]
MSELETIVATLGVERSASLFHSILPLINMRRYELLECLHNQDWESAAQYAHSLLATGHLLASKTLLDQLVLIENSAISIIQNPAFIRQVEAELAASIQQLTQYSHTLDAKL